VRIWISQAYISKPIQGREFNLRLHKGSSICSITNAFSKLCNVCERDFPMGLKGENEVQSQLFNPFGKFLAHTLQSFE
jgi:hypothetical protein